MSTTKNTIDKYDIHILSRSGPPISRNMSKMIFSLAQHMMEEECDFLSFEVETCLVTGMVTTDFKKGSQGKACGTIFRVRIEYGDDKQAIDQPTEILFLATYRIDWRDECVSTWKMLPESSYTLPLLLVDPESDEVNFGGGPAEAWKN